LGVWCWVVGFSEFLVLGVGFGVWGLGFVVPGFWIMSLWLARSYFELLTCGFLMLGFAVEVVGFEV